MFNESGDLVVDEYTNVGSVYVIFRNNMICSPW